MLKALRGFAFAHLPYRGYRLKVFGTRPGLTRFPLVDGERACVQEQPHLARRKPQALTMLRKARCTEPQRGVVLAVFCDLGGRFLAGLLYLPLQRFNLLTQGSDLVAGLRSICLPEPVRIAAALLLPVLAL